jgi:hypothetical protein
METVIPAMLWVLGAAEGEEGEGVLERGLLVEDMMGGGA